MRYALSAALCCLLASTAARAEPPNRTLQLTYVTRGPGASTCPTEVALHKEVRHQIGYDPFRPDAPHRLTATITATITRHGRELTGALQIQDATGHVVWEQDKMTTTGPCATLVMAMGIAVGGWFDESPSAEPAQPPARPPEPPSPPPTPAPVPAPLPAAVPLSPPALPAASKLELRMGLDALFNIGITPSPSIGAGPVFELRPQQSFSIEIGMRGAWTPVAAVLHDVPIRSVYLSGTVAPCGHVAFFSGCAVLEAGALRSQGASGVRIKTLKPAVIDIGARAGAEWPVAKRLTLRGFIELKAVPTVTRLWIDGANEAWTTPPAFFSLGFGVTMRP